MNKLNILPLSENDLSEFIIFADKYIGKNYFNESNFELQIELSTKDNINCSLILRSQSGAIIGVRISYAPGNWINQINTQYVQNTELELNNLGYFKSLFIHPEYQGCGLGTALSKRSMEILKLQGAENILTHSWKESPNNSSYLYLVKNKFKTLGEIPYYWREQDYLCEGCQKVKCICTAYEMIRSLQ